MGKIHSYSITPIAKGLLLLCALGLLPQIGSAQDQGTEQTAGSVRGHVTDPNGQAVIGATVQVKGSSAGTVTDLDGNFSVSAGNGATLVVSYIGFAAKEVPVSGTNLTIQLAKKANDLNEVVVIGYGTTTRREATGSISTIASRDFQQGIITSPDQLISGKAAGVTLTPNDGRPGSGSTINIRGVASLNGGTTPLIVIDGVPLSPDGINGVANPLSLINPNDIESFTVLKDAASTAIYGSRASNGVILITTKKGRKGTPTVTFNTLASVSTVAKKIDVATADQVRAFVNTYGTPAQIAELGNANTDWQDQIYHNAFTTNSNLGISGGTKYLPYRVNINYLDQQGLLRTDYLKRTSASIRLNPVLWDNHLKIDLNINGSAQKTRFANNDAVGSAISMDPTHPVYSGNSAYGGYYEWISGGQLNSLATRNPLGQLYLKNDLSSPIRSFGNLQMDYKFHFLPELHANINGGYDVAKGEGTTFIPQGAAQVSNLLGSSTNYLQHITNTVLEAYLNYNKTIASIKSNINATAGYGYYGFKTNNYNYQARYANGDTLPGSTIVYPTTPSEHNLLSYYARLIYTYDTKYILSGSVRTDASSRYDGRWGTFPSAAFTWRINQENFLKNSKKLSDLKLRLSYGATGNQETGNNYAYASVYGLSTTSAQYQFGNQFYYLYGPSSYNKDIKWESTASYDAGFDIGFLNNRISIVGDAYYKKTTDLLASINIPAGTNFTNQLLSNIGSLSSKGAELAVNAVLVSNKNITWSINVNGSVNSIRIDKLSQLTEDTGSVYVGGISYATGSTIQVDRVGYTPNSFLVFQQVYDKAGKPIEGAYVDRNGDGQINNSDMYVYKAPYPKLILGFSTSITYRKFSLSTTLRANFGNYVYDDVSANHGIASTASILGINAISNFTPDAYTSGFKTHQIYSDYYIKNASFLKMDYVSLGYSFGRLSNYISNLRLSANVQNVFTITKFKGLDPEVYSGIAGSLYPRSRTFSLGLNADF